MMEFLYELRSTSSNLCKLFDFFEDARTAMTEMVDSGKYRSDDLYIARVVTE